MAGFDLSDVDQIDFSCQDPPTGTPGTPGSWFDLSDVFQTFCEPDDGGEPEPEPDDPLFAWGLRDEEDFQPAPTPQGDFGDELGTWFTPNTAITLVGIRIRNPGQEDAVGVGNRFAKLWFRDNFFNDRIGIVQIQDQLPIVWSGWEFDEPFVLVPGENWVVSYNVAGVAAGPPDYYFIPAAFAGGEIDLGDVTFQSGRFSNGTMGAFPDETFNDTFYAVDIQYHLGATAPWNYWVFTADGNFGSFSDGDPLSLGLGVEFESDGQLVGIRLRSPGSSGAGRTIKVWTAAGAQVASKPLPNPLPAGWNRIIFDTPVALDGATEYRISYDVPTGEDYNSVGDASWANTNTRGPITVRDGYFATSLGAFPNTLSGNYYGIDPLWVPA
jgi:hypothetical protein